MAQVEGYLYLEKVLRWSIDFFEGLLASVGHCLHFGGWGVMRLG